jgi:hypothetical protein
MRKVRILIAGGWVILVSGCVLPVPHRRVHVQGVEAKVVNAIDQSPIPGAYVTTTSGRSGTVTDANGDFEIQPVYGWHGAYLIGPISYSLLPHFDMPWSPFLRVSAEGYEPKSLYAAESMGKGEGELVIGLRPQR